MISDTESRVQNGAKMAYTMTVMVKLIEGKMLFDRSAISHVDYLLLSFEIGADVDFCEKLQTSVLIYFFQYSSFQFYFKYFKFHGELTQKAKGLRGR